MELNKSQTGRVLISFSFSTRLLVKISKLVKFPYNLSPVYYFFISAYKIEFGKKKYENKKKYLNHFPICQKKSCHDQGEDRLLLKLVGRNRIFGYEKKGVECKERRIFLYN